MNDNQLTLLNILIQIKMEKHENDIETSGSEENESDDGGDSEDDKVDGKKSKNLQIFLGQTDRELSRLPSDLAFALNVSRSAGETVARTFRWCRRKMNNESSIKPSKKIQRHKSDLSGIRENNVRRRSDISGLHQKRHVVTNTWHEESCTSSSHEHPSTISKSYSSELDILATMENKKEQHETKNYDHLSGWREPSEAFPNDDIAVKMIGAPAHGGDISIQAADREEITHSSTIDDHNAAAPMEKGNDEESSPVDSDMTYEAREIEKRKFVLTELVETERFYVQDLADLVQGYMAEMRNPDSEVKIPEDLKDGKEKMVFGNIQAIYEWHRDFFSKNIERCLENPAELGQVFQRSEKRLQIYVKYCQNKPTSEYIVSEYFTYFEDLRQKLGHKLQIADLLIKPVQRLMKYQLLLRDIHKHTERSGLHQEAECIKRALNIMIVVPKAADDMMNVGRLQGFSGKIMAQGKLLLYGSLLCSEGESAHNFRGKDLMVFLFEQSIIISETGKRKNQFSNPIYQFKQYFQVNKMELEERVDDGDPLKFIIKSKDPCKPNVAYVCQGSDEDNRNQWTSQIRHLLHIQKDFLIAIQNPMAYQKEHAKNV